MFVCRYRVLGLVAALTLGASAASAAVAALPTPADWARRVDADLARGDAADLVTMQRQLQGLIQEARAPNAPAGRLAAVTNLFNLAYARVLAKCPATSATDAAVPGFARIAASLGQPARQRAPCAVGRPGAYIVSGGGNGLKVSGTVSDIAHAFTIKGVIIGGAAEFIFTPDTVGASSGKVRYTIAGSGVTGDGTGTYRLSADTQGVVTLTDTVTGCVHGGGCRTTRETIILTPSGAPGRR